MIKWEVKVIERATPIPEGWEPFAVTYNGSLGSFALIWIKRQVDDSNIHKDKS